MAVRFLPPPPEPGEPRVGADRADLAEVIELRSRISAAPIAVADTAGNVGAELEAGSNLAEVSLLQSGTDTSASLPAIGAPERSAMEDAVRVLARKARSSGELRRELAALGHDPVEADLALLECETRLYLDDLGLARVLTETLRDRKRASRSQIRRKLRERILPDAVIEAALGELDDDEEHTLLREAAAERARKLGGLDRVTAERRLLGFLARRGWSGERAVRAVREALDGDAQGGRSGLGRRGHSTQSGPSPVRFQ